MRLDFRTNIQDLIAIVILDRMPTEQIDFENVNSISGQPDSDINFNVVQDHDQFEMVDTNYWTEDPFRFDMSSGWSPQI